MKIWPAKRRKMTENVRKQPTLLDQPRSDREMQKEIARCTPHSWNRMIFILCVLGGRFFRLVLTSTDRPFPLVCHGRSHFVPESLRCIQRQAYVATSKPTLPPASRRKGNTTTHRQTTDRQTTHRQKFTDKPTDRQRLVTDTTTHRQKVSYFSQLTRQ